MPKNPLKFARRRSSANVLDDIPADSSAPATSSFRVLERPEKINLNGDSPQDRLRKVNRPFQSPLQQLRGGSAEELAVGVNRGSGGTTNSGSSGYYESSSASARHSSSSTLPSSVDAEREREDEELFPRKVKTSPMYQNISAYPDDLPPPRPSFTSRAARALSFGQNRNGTPSNNNSPIPPIPANGALSRPDRNQSPRQRERAMTTSSYASTAKPTKPELNLSLGSADFSSDFGSMFESPKMDKYEDLPPPPPPKAAFHRTESEPMFPPRTHSRQAFKAEEVSRLRDDANTPYEYDRRSSNEGLMSSSAKSSPRIDEFAPAAPPRGSGIVPAFLGTSKTNYSLVPDRYSPGPERSSFEVDGLKEKDGEYDPAEDNPWVKRVELRDGPVAESNSSLSSIFEPAGSATITRKSLSTNANGPPVTRIPLGMPTQASAGASRPGAMSPDSEADRPLWGSESSSTTPRAGRLELPNFENESLFDSSPLGPPSRAIAPQHRRTDSETTKKMTKAQFERLQQSGNYSLEQSDEEEHSADEYEDEDDVDRAKQMAKQRRKQEANMSVYRQQMKKVTGGGPTDLPSMPRPSLDRAAASAPAASGLIHMGGMGGQPPPDAVRGKQTDDDDDDVPLGILQAHGFPSGSRPPTRAADNETAQQRRMSASGSVVGGGAGQGPLPPFARRLPADPYFGSSLVNQSNRESLGMSSAASVHGGFAPMQPMMPPVMPPSMGHPGGLVGVIAGEEKAKAARRGSPNPATGAFTNPGIQPPMGGMLGMGRTMTMPNMAPPSVYTPTGMGMGGSLMMPQMPGMPMMPPMQPMQQQPNPQQDQMQKFMEMQMQVMQNMLAMQQQQMGQAPPPQTQQTPDYLGVPSNNANRMSTVSQRSNAAPSIKSQAPLNQGRAMTMMHPPTRWDVAQSAQRPNSAMPTTYAPSGMHVNHGGPGPGYSPSIAPSERSNVGMPSRYRPVTNGNDPYARSQSMTSSATLLTFGTSQEQPPPAQTHQTQPQPKSTVRLINKPKGAPKVATRTIAADEDEDEGWAEMRKKRDDKKKFRFGKKEKYENWSGDLYQSLD